ncbi:hypothetical protein TNCV_4779941 [Trichonephila clavipes]|nr:hypothetical protein TNCV_4779941 [Trichonephila clavipes]
MSRRVVVVVSNNSGYSGYCFWQKPHFREVYKFNHLILGQQNKFFVLCLVCLGVAFTVASSVFHLWEVWNNISCHRRLSRYALSRAFSPYQEKNPPNGRIIDFGVGNLKEKLSLGVHVRVTL